MNIFDKLTRNSRAYRELFNSSDPNVQVVMADLKRFCRYRASTYSENPQRQSFLNGKRDVLERILDFADLTEGEIRNMKEGT